ncbi:hypothetical protein JGU71_13520 [Antrihabitans sp. YC3-6]|uniref:Uncharacterized protein n=1 Tax=Antrihabitans stalagmiti TaxID=2799499 RepID=A0A934NRD8_9NOCA|nr:DUF6480 family protein [Antrihabitans stalagmiti]MBJ8339910.1 hypothetical protein [Antrihabitans stalagmiti]
MASPDSGPTPDDSPGLEAGGGVTPGDTPPDAGQTSGLSHPQPMPSRTGPIIALVLVAFFTLAFAVFLAARVFALF